MFGSDKPAIAVYCQYLLADARMRTESLTLPKKCSSIIVRCILAFRLAFGGRLARTKRNDGRLLKLWDLHSHTTASDGDLPPVELWKRAADNNIDHLAITDHDTISGVSDLVGYLSQIADASEGQPVSGIQPRLIPGVEITALSGDVVVHILGLWIDIDEPGLLSLLDRQREARSKRAQQISDRLEQAGLPPTLDGANKLANGSVLGRPHFARYLTQIGAVKDENQAFKQWLGRGKIGDIRIAWPSQAEVVAAIHQAGGTAVLAHPGKYLDGFNKCYALCERFKADGGDALEVVSGAQLPKATKDLARIAARLELAASTGSDFHSPQQTWCDLGGQPGLPDSVEPVWQLRARA